MGEYSRMRDQFADKANIHRPRDTRKGLIRMGHACCEVNLTNGLPAVKPSGEASHEFNAHALLRVQISYPLRSSLVFNSQELQLRIQVSHK